METSKICKGSLVMRGICDAALVGLPLGVAATFVVLPRADHMMAVPSGLSVSPDITLLQNAGAIVVGLIPLVILMWTIWTMRCLFGLFASGAVLTPSAAQRIRRIGWGFLALALAPLVIIPAQSVLLTWANPVGQRMVSVSLSSDMLGFAVVSGLLILIGWAMAQAAEVAAENESFI